MKIISTDIFTVIEEIRREKITETITTQTSIIKIASRRSKAKDIRSVVSWNEPILLLLLPRTDLKRQVKRAEAYKTCNNKHCSNYEAYNRQCSGDHIQQIEHYKYGGSKKSERPVEISHVFLHNSNNIFVNTKTRTHL